MESSIAGGGEGGDNAHDLALRTLGATLMPQYRDDLTLDAVIREVFADADPPGIHAVLTGICPGQHERVQVAVVLLSEGRIDRLRHYAREAALESRDVLYWAFSYGDAAPARLQHLVKAAPR